MPPADRMPISFARDRRRPAGPCRRPHRKCRNGLRRPTQSRPGHRPGTSLPPAPAAAGTRRRPWQPARPSDRRTPPRATWTTPSRPRWARGVGRNAQLSAALRDRGACQAAVAPATSSMIVPFVARCPAFSVSLRHRRHVVTEWVGHRRNAVHPTAESGVGDRHAAEPHRPPGTRTVKRVEVVSRNCLHDRVV